MSFQAVPSVASLLPDSASFSASGVLHIAGHAVPELARQYGTPCYIFDRATIVNACETYKAAFQQYYQMSPVRILYASKAYLSPLVAQLVYEQGLGLDVVSGGELLVAQRANVPMHALSFHGNNKAEDELRLALQFGVGRIVLDNESELKRLSRLAQEAGQKPGVLLRVAPAIETETHPYLQTGHAASKFGFALENGAAKAAILRIIGEGQVRLLGLHAHVGTMLRDVRPYQQCVERLLALAAEIYGETGWWPEEISPGGGWAIDVSGDEPAPPVALLAQALEVSMESSMVAIGHNLPAPTLVIEPGRSIIGRAGMAIYRVGARKATQGGVTYIFVDGGMADNIRPALYGAEYTALAVERATALVEETVCVAGRYCESGDVLIEHIALPMLDEGDLLAIPGVGAYCLAMASNYNLQPRPAVLLVNEREVKMMQRRETDEDVLGRFEDA